MTIKLLLLLSMISFLNGQIVNHKEIDFSLTEIQLISSKDLDYIKSIQDEYKNGKDFDIYYEKNNYYALYAVNIESSKSKRILEKLKLKSKFSTAFILNKKEYKVVDIPAKVIIKKDNAIKSKDKIKVLKKVKHIDKVVNKYEVAISFYKNKNYQVSYEIFNALFKNDLENKQINFYLARSAFELKKYDEAYSAYERILIKYPNEIRAKLEIARINFIQKRYKSSKKKFLELKKQNLPKEVIKNINMYLSKIDKKLQKSFLNGIYQIGLGYDSNINNRSIYDSFYIPSSSVIWNNTTKDESSSNIYTSLFLNHKYLYSDSISFKNNFLVYAKKVLKDSSKNVGFVSYIPSVITLYDNVSIEYSVFTDFLRYENEYYMNSYGINPQINYVYSSNLQFALLYKYQKKNNKINNNKNKDSIYKSLNVGVVNIINNKYTISSSVNFENERKENSTLTNVDYNSKLFKILLEYKLSKKISISPSILYKNKKYKDININYLKKQINDEYTYNMNVQYIFDNSWMSQTSIVHNNVKSNIDSSSYKKNTISISFMKRF